MGGPVAKIICREPDRIWSSWKEMKVWLEANFKNDRSELTLVSDLKNLKQGAGEGGLEYVARLRSLYSEISDSGMSEKWFTLAGKEGLRGDYKALLHQNTPTLSSLAAGIQEVDARLGKEDATVPDRNFPPSIRKISKSGKFNGFCNFCGYHGHKAHDCRAKRNGKAPATEDEKRAR